MGRMTPTLRLRRVGIAWNKARLRGEMNPTEADFGPDDTAAAEDVDGLGSSCVPI